MKIGVKFSGIRVDGELIIDGHHRYLASLLAGVSLEMYPSIKTSATKIIEWNNVDFVKDDWDTEVKILLMNKIDAEYNGMSLEKLNELLT
ncbi:MAG: ParB/Srx family N-terminal domain-containing protein [Bacteroidetes bacterium]|nr:ParB/Srx family N-terminal domain-containing protein [Bacteroidota bacterium]